MIDINDLVRIATGLICQGMFTTAIVILAAKMGYFPYIVFVADHKGNDNPPDRSRNA